MTEMVDISGITTRDLVAQDEIEFLYEIQALRAKLDTAKPFYVYMLHKPDFTPFYVGKGTGSRILNHESDARNITLRSHKLNVIRAIHRAGRSVVYLLDGFFDQEKDALARERELIAEVGRHDLGRGPLTNQTDGGEGTSNPSLESRERRAATLGGLSEDTDRRAANQFFASISGRRASVPIKPLGARRLEITTPHANARSPRERMATALVAAAIASGRMIAVGSILPRLFEMNGHPLVIENGVSRDMLKAGMITIEAGATRPEREMFRLTETGYAAILRFIRRRKLIDLGVLEDA
ncbi:GIY-YIG nuclease family protein [Bradyrhizobium sp. 6(2017)]|uniref:GIY-YIG nuclease family protein n=1 Tax=Bradyrhizobium sp. 6(2017) TaxID=1197460 RepID=UPI0013E1806D|nr:GIY-YIG nuclease family protein [Bradyrhizobium sp. 6(2017)]QIG96578.1 GIY-YIG nuclease family protein [Bradyrhizobium sp. 6(2017)]